jgi:MFS family permease
MSSAQSQPNPELIDPRGPRFGAAITSVLLALAIVLGPAIGGWVLLLQTLAFAAGSLLGLGYQPWGWVYRKVVRPRLAPPAELEDNRPPRFAQTVGLVFGLAGLVGWAFSLPVLFYVAVGFALVAALLNAIFDYCLGCEIYLLSKRVFGKVTPAAAG